jgi:glycosyltransferase involved in cell wall biosynthesis
METPRISVVIPTYRRPELLVRCLAAVLSQRIDAGAYEIIVVDDGHDDATQAAVAALAPTGADAPALRYLRPGAGRGPAVARNCGWHAARGALIAFTDDDTVPDRDWLANGERAIAAGFVAVSGRVVVPVPPDEPPTDHELMTLGLESAEFVTANAFVRRDALERVHGFDERFRRAWREDSDLQFRLEREAGPVGRSEAPIVLHPVRGERWGVCLRQQRNAYYDALLYKKHPKLYRERIRRSPPWNYYAIVVLTLLTPLLAWDHLRSAAAASAAIALTLVLQLTWRRLKCTSRKRDHVLEMFVTSALIPFLSVYWRLRGAVRFRVLFL